MGNFKMQQLDFAAKDLSKEEVDEDFEIINKEDVFGGKQKSAFVTPMPEDHEEQYLSLTEMAQLDLTDQD